MSGLVLTLREPRGALIDMTPLTPDRLQNMSLNQVAALPLQAGRRRRAVAELFELSGEPHEAVLTVNSPDVDAKLGGGSISASRLSRFGAGMSGGHLQLNGSAGPYCALALVGGQISVSGDCGDYAGAAMSGGRLSVAGNVGDGLASAPGGERLGMRGGLVVVRGNAGHFAGDRLRRGTVLIEGSAGDSCGARMIAGSLLVFGSVGAVPGLNMRRGTLWLAQTTDLPATFGDNGEQHLSVLALLWRSLAAVSDHAAAQARQPGSTRVRRWLGDSACGGQGEVLFALDDANDAASGYHEIDKAPGRTNK